MKVIQNITEGQALCNTLQTLPKLNFPDSKILFPSLLSLDSTFPALLHPQL